MYELVDYDKTPHLVKHCDLSDILRCLSLSEEKTDCSRIFFQEVTKVFHEIIKMLTWVLNSHPVSQNPCTVQQK